MANTTTSERVALADISQFMGGRSIGALLLFLSLPMVLPIPAPGISVVFGIPLIVIAGQLAFGKRTAWIPARIARRAISKTDLRTYVTRAMPTLHKIEGVLRPRWKNMTGDRATQLVGGVSMLLAVIITLPIPFGHMVPGASISVMSLGLIEKDGVAISVGLLIALLALLVVFLATTGLLAAERAWI